MTTGSHRPDRIGIEIGGTFTDMVMALPDGSLRTCKTPSTPRAVEHAVLEVLDISGAALDGVRRLAHGSTVATNALLTRRGAATGLLTTKGFRDVLILARADRDHNIFDMRYRHPEPPIRRHMIAEVPERLDATGAMVTPLDLAAGWAAAQTLLDQGAVAIAICLLHAWRNPAHEQALAAMIRDRAPHVALSLSSAISPEFREYERSLTTVVNAFVGQVVARYVARLDDGLRARGHAGVLQIMQSNGGTMPAAVAESNAVRMLLSGPAAGVRAAMWFARRNGISDAITLDMGGTSTDIAIAPDLAVRIVPQLMIDGLPMRTATVDIATIGAGGGSIAALDPGGFLAVGPASAGAHPGPACYGMGGLGATVTDAQVVAGILRPDHFFDGKMTLRPDLAADALLGLAPDGAASAADAVLRIVNANMAGAVRQISTQRGVDPAGFTLIAYGGGGPLHAASVAKELGLRRVLIPWSPGLVSAFGLLVADTVLDATISDLQPLSDSTLDADRLRMLGSQSRATALAGGLDPETCETQLALDMRYGGQAFELSVPLAATVQNTSTLRAAFEAEHRQRYGYARASLPVEVVSYRLRVLHAADGALHPPLPDGQGGPAEHHGITLDGQRLTATFLPRRAMVCGATLDGPAVLEEPTSTILVPPGWRATCLPTGDLLLEDVA